VKQAMPVSLGPSAIPNLNPSNCAYARVLAERGRFPLSFPTPVVLVVRPISHWPGVPLNRDRSDSFQKEIVMITRTSAVVNRQT
jgi:hypothetical protein